MEIRLLTDRVGGNGFLQSSGDVIDLPQNEAYRLIQRGQAEALETESAAVVAGENTARSRPRFKRN